MRTKIAIPLLTAAALFFGMSGMDALAGDSNAEIRYYGDLDGDEVISSYDLVMLRQCIYDYERFDTAQHYISDLDADGTIGKSDLELLSDYLLGKISAFPAGEYITKDIYAPAQISFIEPSITAMGASMPHMTAIESSSQKNAFQLLTAASIFPPSTVTMTAI